MPLLAREKLVGVLTLVHPAPNAFSAEQLDLMQAISDQAGIAVLNARLYTESQRQARVMTALAEGAAAMNAAASSATKCLGNRPRRSVVAAERPDDIRLELLTDNAAEFYQWFFFRVTGAKGVPLTHRDHASWAVLATGHGTQPDWEIMAAAPTSASISSVPSST